MFRFLSTLFGSSDAIGTLDDRIIELAIERAIDGTDPRLRGFPRYRKRVRPAAARAANHVIELVEGLPPAVEIGAGHYTRDPRLRAFFASPDRLRTSIAQARTITDYLAALRSPSPDPLYGLLTMEWEQSTRLGMELQGDRVQRDVHQTVVNFSAHRYVGLGNTAEDSRRELMKRAFDFLVERVLERIAAERVERADLEQQKVLLRSKLKAMQAGNWALESMLDDTESGTSDPSRVEREIREINDRLGTMTAGTRSLEHQFEHFDAVLGEPEHWLNRRDVELHLTQMGVKVDPSSGIRADRLELIELHACTGARRIVLPVRIPGSELPGKGDFFASASQYLR